MNTKQLKDKILSMAMRGELVEHTNEIEQKTFGDLCTIVRGGSPRPIKDYITDDENGINWIKIGDTKPDSKYIVSSVEKIKEDGLKSTRLVKKGDLILSNSMSFGRPYILKIDGAIHDGWLAISDFKEYYNTDFLYYLLSSNLVYKQFSLLATGTTVKNLNKDRVASITVPIFSLDYQEQVVEKIETLFKEVDKLEESSEKLDKLKDKLDKKLLDMAMRGELVEQDLSEESAELLLEKIKEEKAKLIAEKKIKKEKPLAPIEEDEIPYDLPQGWVWTRLGEVCEKITDGAHKTPTYTVEGVPFLSVQNISSGKFTFDKIKYVSEEEHQKLAIRVLPQQDDILFCRIGTLGKAIKVTLDYEFSIFVSLGLIRLINKELTDYIIHFINSPQGYAWIESVKVGGGTHTNKINLRDVPNMLIPLPPLAEQKRIVEKLEIAKEIIKETL